jgi:hypothetical protein
MTTRHIGDQADRADDRGTDKNEASRLIDPTRVVINVVSHAAVRLRLGAEAHHAAEDDSPVWLRSAWATFTALLSRIGNGWPPSPCLGGVAPGHKEKYRKSAQKSPGQRPRKANFTRQFRLLQSNSLI